MKRMTYDSGPHSVSAVILAAGYSSRMGRMKALLPIEGVPTILRQIRALTEAGVEKIVVVTGYREHDLTPLLQGEPVDLVYNPDYPKGMFTSVQAGVRSLLESESSGFFLLPVDYPLMMASTLRELIRVFSTCPDAIVVPTHLQKKGHPPIFPIAITKEVLEYQGEQGLKGMLQKSAYTTIKVETDDAGVVMDMNTEEMYQTILSLPNQPAKKENPGSIEHLKGRTLYLIRHGEIKPHESPIFLGQTDALLGEEGEKQADVVGHKLWSESPDTDIIYCSDLSRCIQTAKRIAKQRGDRQTILHAFPEFRELYLGHWEGKAIRDIMEEEPLAYEERGKELLSYQIDEQSETFYELKARVIHQLREILKQHEGDVILISHAGVNAIISHILTAKPLAEAVKQKQGYEEIYRIPL